MAGIFLSCVSQEFHGSTAPEAVPWPGSYRAQLAHYLQECGQQVVYQETFAQGGGDLLAKLDDYISQECKAVIHLIGHARGWSLEDDLPAGIVQSDAVHSLLDKYGDSFLASRPELKRHLQARGFRGLSVTQWEAWLAIHHQKPLLVFTFADSAERHHAFRVEASVPADRVTQVEHLAWLRETGFDRTEQIKTVSHLKEKVISGLLREQIITESESRPRPRCSEFSSIGSLFMGRMEDMEKLRASLHKESHRATAIVASQVIYGQGGIGKTRLALEFGLAHADEYAALLFVGADSPQSFEANLARLAGPLVLDLGLPENAKDDDKLAAVLHWLRAHPGYFLILDNVDTEAAAQAVEAKLALLSDGHVVITSRITQWSESVEPLQLDVLSEQAATAFLLQATERKAGSGRIVSPTDEADARLLAKDVDGLALALEQSAAFIRTKQTTFAKYRKRWAKFDRQVRDFKDQRLTKYPHSVVTTWQTTFEQLTPGSVELLRVCSVMAPAPIPLHLLESVVKNSEDDLAELVKFSLAGRSDDGSAVRVHKVVQEIVFFRMEEGDRQKPLERVLDALRALFSNNKDHTLMPRRSAVLSHVDAVVVSAEHIDRLAESSARLRADVANHQLLIGQLSAAMANISASMAWSLKQSPVDERSLAIRRAKRASIQLLQGDLPGALKDITYSIEWGLKQSPVDEGSLADWRATRASIRQCQKDLPGAIEETTYSIEWGLKQSPVAERNVAIWRARRASIREEQGDLPGAIEDITYSIEWGLKQSPVDERMMAIWQAARASIRQAHGDLPGAIEDITYSIEWGLKQSPVDERGMAIDRATRASIRQDQGDLPGAIEDITSALAWFEANLPGDIRSIDIMKRIRDSIKRGLIMTEKTPRK